jgi:Fe-S-cluster containining protein
MSLPTADVEGVLCRICGARCCQRPVAQVILYEDTDVACFVGKLPICEDGGVRFVEFDGRCPNLTVDNVCAIYVWRPSVCRRWPHVGLTMSGCMIVAYRLRLGEVEAAQLGTTA